MTDPIDDAGTDDLIAVVGLACRVPGARDPEQLWANLLAGVESVDFHPRTGQDPPHYVPASPSAEGAAEFDAEFFGMSPREAELTDPQQRRFLECSWEALESAGQDPAAFDGRIGVWGGSSVGSYLLLNLMPHHTGASLLGDYPAMLLHGNEKDHLTTRVAYKLGLTGPAVTVQSACSSSLVAVAQACQSLLDYGCDLALAGGTSLKLPLDAGYLYEQGSIFSPDGHCRAFDADAAGTLFGTGTAVVALRRLRDALADGDPVRAVIRGAAVNNDGSGKAGYTAPGVDGQAAVIAEAYDLAGVSPLSIGYVEAHGTGTPIGDPIEVAALTEVYAAEGAGPGSCLLGSVKTNLGHLNAAAGAVGLIKAVLAVERGAVPPSLHFRRFNPAIDADTVPFRVPVEVEPWPKDGPRRAAVSSFGIGGTNAHLVVEQAPARPAAGTPRAHQVLPLSARTPQALERAVRRLTDTLADGPADLPGLAHTLRTGRRAFPHRTALVAGPDGAVRALPGPSGPAAPAGRARVALLLPGQGAQYSGMAAEVHRTEPVFRAHFDECAELLRGHLGRDLRELVDTEPPAPGAPDPLTGTALAQPALFAVEYALARYWESLGVRPAALVGHSVGEWTAACLAGVFDLPDALALVAARGRLMQALPPGGMLAVELTEPAAVEFLAGHPELSLAAVNAPGRCVLAGPPDAVAAAVRALALAGVPARRLHTSHAFHSAVLDPVLAPFAEQVAARRRNRPTLPFTSSLTGTWITPEQAVSPRYWADQARGCVRFADAVRTAAGVADVLLETGPGRTLGRLAAECAPAAGPRPAVLASLRHPRQGAGDAESLARAAGALWAHGADLDWRAYDADRGHRRGPAPTYPFEPARHWVDPPAAAPAPAPAPAAAAAPAAPAPAVPTPVAASGPEAERPAGVQDRVIALWGELLGVSGLGPDDDFFEHNGDSVLATRLVSRARHLFGVELPLDDLLDEPTVGGMTRLVEDALARAA
ncbi:acyl transferase domain-containing protein [Kitasatospora sp. SolWspMP-SS2h]|uniref:type I polyketide synthase n=1 Tax=Kitasatospora sp. SolWspMP-SS2h TaxID=1305729 RepID=UPI000DBA5211|nr:type I polyketide synthase [Kitasatospora sp. SolWspMP-SS2h]RAJ36138.1 acyl transferase domain-containing protein [Kitasatospora sp. SolWspMP-SS2h]